MHQIKTDDAAAAFLSQQSLATNPVRVTALNTKYNKDTFTMATAPPVVVSPDTELQFVLSESEATPKCSMTISHPGGGVTEHIAFKVR
jgi:hypothetical protein